MHYPVQIVLLCLQLVYGLLPAVAFLQLFEAHMEERVRIVDGGIALMGERLLGSE